MGKWRCLGERESLEISAPTSAEQFVRNFKHTIIVICKHGFTAENNYELTTHEGDILKVLERPGNGWILVQFLDTVNKYGLIPAKYVDIAVNDPLDPITLQWLHQVDELSPTNSISHNQSKDIGNDSISIVRRISSHNKSYPKSASISNVLLLDNRYWYRLDITYTDNSKAYVRRYYEDFYNLHGSLLNVVGNMTDINGNATPSMLPKLPEPIPSTASSKSNDLILVLLKRCNDLNIYINRIFNDKRFQKSNVLYEWLDISYRDLGGLICPQSCNLTNEEITRRISPYSLDILDSKPSRNRDDNATLNRQVIPISSSAFSEGHDNSIGQLRKDNAYKTIASRPPKLTVNTSNHNYNDSVGSHSETSIFSDIDSVKTPDTPFSFSHEVFTQKNNYVKLKIIKQNEDIVALKVNRNDIKSIADLKKLIGAKLPYKSLYIKLREFKHIDSHDYKFIQVLNESEKIVLRVT